MPTLPEILDSVSGQSPPWTQVSQGFASAFPNEDPVSLEQRYEASRLVGGVNAESPAWDQIAERMRRAFPDISHAALQTRYEDRRNMAQARQQYASYEEDWPTYLARRAAPFASTIAAAKMSMEYNAARQRIAAGQGRRDRSQWSDWLVSAMGGLAGYGALTTARNDYELVAEYERLNQIDQQRGVAQHIGSALANIPAIAGEAFAGGLALRGLGIGARAAAATPSLLSTEGLANLFTREGARAVAGEAPAWAGRLAAQTAVMPSMWLTTAAQRAGQGPADQQWYSPSNLVPSFALGLTQTAVLGSLGHIANGVYGGGVGAIAKRLAARTGLGMAEQQALDIVTSAASEVLPEAWKLNTGYGILGAALHGDWGEAWKHTAVQLATFAAFSTMHEIQAGPPIAPTDRMRQNLTVLNLNPQAAEQVLSSFEAYTNKIKKQGIGREGAAKKAQEVFDTFIHEINDNPHMDRETAVERMRALFSSGPAAEFAQSLAQTMPEKLGPAEPAGFGRQQRVETPPGWGERMTVEPPPPPEPPPVGGHANVAREFYEQQRIKLRQAGYNSIQADLTARQRTAGKFPELADWIKEGGVVGIPGQPRAPTSAAAPAAPPAPPEPPPPAGARKRPKPPPEQPAPKPPEPPAAPEAKPAEPTNPVEPASREEAKREAKWRNLPDLAQQATKAHPEVDLDGHRRNVRELGSMEAAFNSYKGSDKINEFAREYARFYYSEPEKAFRANERAKAAQTPEAARQIRLAEIESHIADAKLSNSEKYVAREHFLKGRQPEEMTSDKYLQKQYGGKVSEEYLKKKLRDAAARLGYNLETKPGTLEDYARTQQPGKGGASLFKGSEGQRVDERTAAAEPVKPAGTKEKPVGPYEWIRSALTMFGLHRYIGAVRENADAAYLEHVRAMEAGGMQAGDVPITTHEIAHHLMREYGFEANPLQIPEDVRAGLRAFDYNHARPESNQAMREGFAEWLRIRETNAPFLSSEKMTPEMQAAAKWAEGWVKEKGLTEKLDRLRDQYTSFESQNPVQRFQGNISATGEPAKPTGLTPGERAGLHLATGWEGFLTQFVDRYHVFDMLEKERQRLGMAPMKKGQDLRSVFTNTHFMGATYADEMAGKGMFVFERTPDGSWRKTTIGKPIDWITEGFKPEDLQTKANGTSRLGAFLIANHLVGEVGRGKETVASAEQIKLAREVLAYEKANDPQFHDRALEAARRYTKLSELTLDVKVRMGMMTQEFADRLKKEHPDFVSLQRVMEDTSYEPGGIMARAGSGRQFIDPMVTLRGRYEHLANEMTKQLKDYAFHEAMKQAEGPRGVSGFAKETERPVRLDEINRAGLQQILEALGFDQMERQILIDQHGDAALEYVQPTKQKDGHLLYPMMIDGKQVVYEIGNRTFFDALTQQQAKEGVASYAAKLAALPGLSQATAAMKAGATSASLIFSVRNIFRDAWHYWQNAEGTAVEKLGKLLAGHMEAARESAKQVLGIEPDVFWKLYKGSAAEELRAFQFAPRGEGEAAWRRATGTAGAAKEKGIWVVNKVKDLMEAMGFGEHGPRFAEFKSALLEMGYTREKIQKALEANVHDSPIPLDVQLYARTRAANATTDFSRQGAFIHEWNKIVPFVGPHIAGMVQEAKNWNAAAAEMRSGVMGPKAKAMVGALTVYLGAEIAHWLTFRNDDWYNEQPANQRYGWWIMGKTSAGGVWGIPKPQGVMRMVGAFFQELLRTESGHNPRVGMAAQDVALQQSMPRMLPIGASEAVQVASNTSWQGMPIVPRQEERRLTDSEKWLSFRLPYIVEQLSGGLAGQRTILTFQRPTAALEASQVAPHQSVQDWHDALNALEQQRTAARSRGLQFPQERDYQIAHSIADRMARLSAELRGERRAGGTLRIGEAPSDERKIEIRREQLRLSRSVMDRLRQ